MMNLSNTDLAFLAIGLFVGIVVCGLWALFRSNEKALIYKGGIIAMNKIAALEKVSPEQAAKNAASAAHEAALRQAFKDAANEL